MKKVYKFLLVLLLPVLAVVFTQRAYAEPLSSEEIFKRILINQVEYCYKQALIGNIESKDFNGFGSLMNEGYKNSKTDLDRFYIPALDNSWNNISQVDNDGGRVATCYALFDGDNLGSGLGGKMEGLFDIYGKSVPGYNASTQAKSTFMGDALLQYSVNTATASTNEYCYTVKGEERGTAKSEKVFGQYCLNEDNFEIGVGTKNFGKSEDSKYSVSGKVSQNTNQSHNNQEFEITVKTNCSGKVKQAGIEFCEKTIKIGRGIPTIGSKEIWSSTNNSSKMLRVWIEYSKREVANDASSDKVSYSKKASDDTWKSFVQSLTDGNIGDRVAFSDADKYDLYVQYLRRYYGMGALSSSVCESEKPSALVDRSQKHYYVYMQGSGWCLANLNDSYIDSSHAMTVFSSGERYKLDKVIKTLPELINLMGELDYSSSDFSNIDEVGTNNGVQSQEDGKSKGSCKAGAAGALGWIVCPIMEWMANASKKMYNEYVEPALRVDPKLFGDPGSSNTWQAWSIFQRIANTIFIIILLIVIFSQLTGVGIDNYGIKKILPKLIIAAVLVNLSYYICLICVDLSNIFGNGLQDMFMEMGRNLTISGINVDGETISLSGASEVVNSSGASEATVMTAMPILGALIAGGAAIYLNPAILLTLLISAIGIVVAIFFLFMLLSVREAAIIVLTIISPIAFVLYMLPNTKKLFDKWLGIWKVLLLLYPICGLLVGGGSFVSKLLISSGVSQGGFINAFMAMVVGIAPIFFIPTLLRNSLNALGSLGAKISGLGQRIGGGLQKGARNSEAYKNAQKRGLENRTRIKAGVDRNGNLTRIGAWRARHAGRFGARQQAAYISQAKKNIGESEAAGALLTGALARTGIAEAEGLPDSGQDEELGRSFAEHTEGAYYGGQFLEAADAGDITNMNATIEAMRSSGMKPKDIAKLMRYANNHGHFNNMNDNTRAAWFRELSKKYGNDFLATDFELNSYLRAGGFGRDASGNITGALGGYGEYGGVKIDDVKPEDIVKLSGDSMAGLAASGVLNQSMAQRVIAMNPNISADKKIMLGAIASGAANATTINDVAQFKKDAETLMKDYNAGSPVAPATMGANGAIDRATVEAWASATPQSVNVVQNFNGGGSQIGSVDVNLRDIGGQRLGGGGTS